MAVLSKIRERSMFLIIIIGLALFAFVLDPSTLGDLFNSSKVNEIGEVDGDVISRQEFTTALEAYKTQTGSSVSDIQATKTVWDNIVRKKIYQAQLEKAGIVVGENDVWMEVLNSQSVQGNPEFLNEAGIFDESKVKQFLKDIETNNTQLSNAWNNYIKQIKDNSERNTYNNLVTAGLGASLKEGENNYLNNNTKLNAQFVYLPFTSLADSLVKVSTSEITSYINDHEKDFQVEASRDLSYVKFDTKATAEDQEAIKSELSSLKEEFKTTTNNVAFLLDNDSDLDLDEIFKFKNQVPVEVAATIFDGKEGDVFGPYKESGYFKMTKITEVVQMPDSVKASHILIPFVGSQRATPDITRTEAQAEKLADSILAVVKRSKRKFKTLAKQFSSDKANAEKGGDLGYFNYARMTPAFRDFTFAKKVGSVGVVKTPFGFHIIRVDAQKNKQSAMKLATIAKKIVPSEATENVMFENAEKFALEVSKNGNFYDVAKANNYTARPAIGVKVLDESVPGLGKERGIVSWAFGDVEVGDFQRFDTENGHVVVFITAKTKKGTAPVAKEASKVRAILLKEKKATLLSAKMTGSSLAEIANANKTSVRNASNISLQSTTLSGAGAEPKVVGAMFYAGKDKLHTKVVGSKGVYAFVVTKKELPTALPNYDAERKRIADARKRQTFKMYEALKSAATINDNRGSALYGANQ